MVTVVAMSDTSDTSDDGASPGSSASSKSSLNAGDICRDYLRNVCKRGKRCKFRHPAGDEAKQLGRKHDFTFCHDFQNSGCRRANCRFIHCTREEEEYFKQTGQLPVRLQQAAALGLGVVPTDIPLLKGEVPICKDFLKGECKRQSRCKFRHLTPSQYDMELRRGADRTRSAQTEMMETFSEDYLTEHGYELLNPCESSLKRKRLTMDLVSEELQYRAAAAAVAAAAPSLPPAAPAAAAPAQLTATDYRLLDEENSMLRRKVEELKKQVSDLVATNEVLLEQNARYRASKNSTCIPIVTVSQVVTPTITPTVARTSMPPIAAAQPINPLSTTVNTLPQLRLDVTNSELVAVSQQALQPRLATEMPVTVATLVPVSLSMDSGMAPPCSSSHTVPQSLAQHSNFVSYPIMSHSLTQLPNTARIATLQPTSTQLALQPNTTQLG